MKSTILAKLRRSKNRTACVVCRYLSRINWRPPKLFRPITQVQPVPYAERIVQIPRGPALVWPYYNIRLGEGPFEIAPDSNSYRNPNWVEQLPSSMPRHKVIVNLLPALAEEWLANEQFRSDPEHRIVNIIARYEERGICFRKTYAADLTNILVTNSVAFRYNWTILLFYVAVALPLKVR